MGITSINVISRKSSAGDNISNVRKYLILSDTYLEPEAVRVATYTGKPNLGDVNTADTATVVSNVDCEYIIGSGGNGEKYAYEYTVTCTVPKYEDEDKENPLADPPDIEWGGNDAMETVYFDLDNKPIQNSAKQHFDNQPQRPQGEATVTITRNEATNPATNIITYSNSINNATWNGVAAYKAKLGRITASKQYKNGVAYWKVSYPISFNENGYRFKIIDAGTAILSDGKPVTQFDATGKERQLLLDGSGAELGAELDPVQLTFKLLKEKSWSSLSLPNPFA